MRVLFCHGKEGNPKGSKAVAIGKIPGTTVVTPKLTNSYERKDFVNDLGLIEALAAGADVLVGSSRGGALIANTKLSLRKVLIAPAWKRFGVEPNLTKEDIILHSKHDDLVPYEDSVTLAERFGCTLIECGVNHRMSDEATLAEIKKAILNN